MNAPRSLVLTDAAVRLYFVTAPLAALAAVLAVGTLALQAAPVAADSLARAINPAPESAVSPEFLADFGFYISRFIAGLGGGFLNVLYLTLYAPRRASTRINGPAAWGALVFAGGLLGNYGTPLLAPVFGDAVADAPAASLLLGFGGLPLFNALLSRLMRLLEGVAGPRPPEA